MDGSWKSTISFSSQLAPDVVLVVTVGSCKSWSLEDPAYFSWVTEFDACTEMDEIVSTNGLSDDLTTMVTEEPAEEVYPYVFPPSTHVFVGSYLIIIGKWDFCLELHDICLLFHKYE